MKAVRLHAYGDVDQFTFEDVPNPVPGDGEVLIRVVASGLNPVDLYIRQGYMAQIDPIDLPAILGVDAAGTVVALGPGVTGYALGDQVIAHVPLSGSGAQAQFAAVPVVGLAKLPLDISFAEGATLPLAGLTGRQAVDALVFGQGTRVLVSGALGSVGRVAVQYLESLGAKPVAGVRAERLAEGQALAGEAVAIDLPPSAPQFDVAVSAAAPVAGNVIGFVQDGGRVASVVQMPSDANPASRVEVIEVVVRDDATQLGQVAEAAGRGDLRIPIAQTFALRELAAAHQALAAGPRGKILLRH
jgi:NADPH:quinone reductase-like Zn-dependent oxidoreductase